MANVKGKADNAAVLKLIRGGKLTYREVGEKTGWSVYAVTRLARKHGITRVGVERGAQKESGRKTAKRVMDAAKKGGSLHDIAKRAGVHKSTVAFHLKSPPSEESVAPCPPPEPREYQPFVLPKAGHWLVLGDVHIPYHDRATVEAAVKQAKRDGAVGVVLNGDIVDSHEISSHDKDPSAPRYVNEIERATAFMRWLRAELPKVEIVFKEGNHEERLDRYILGRAPALFGLEFVNLRSLLHFADLGVTEVRDKRVIKAGKLHIVHGHEYRGGGGVNPARWLYLRARSVSMCGHFHRVSEHHERDIADKVEASWSVGCACDLKPMYSPLNNWGNGFAMVEVAADANFTVRNMRVMGGKVL